MEHGDIEPTEDLNDEVPEHNPVGETRHLLDLWIRDATNDDGDKTDGTEERRNECRNLQDVKPGGLTIPPENLLRKEKGDDMPRQHRNDTVMERNESPEVMLVLEKLR